MPSDPPRPLPVVAAAAACALVAGAARVWVHRDLYANDPTLAVPVLDDRYYLETIARIARGERFDSFLAHLHPWLASVAGAGKEPTLAFLGGVNAVLGALTSGVVALAAGLAAGRRAALVAGLLHALAGVFLFHDVLPGQEAGVGLGAALAIACGVALLRPDLRRFAALAAVGLGVGVGIAALGRGTSLALLACALPAVGTRRPRLGTAALCAAGLALVLCAGAVRNQRVGGPLSPFPWSGGANLYLANGPDARTTVSMGADLLGRDPWSIERNAVAVPSRAEGRPVLPRETSGWWLRRTLADSGGAGALAAHVGRKALLFLSADERGSNHAPAAERDFALLLRVLPVSGWWLLAVGAGCWWLARRQRPAADVAFAAVAGTWLALTVFFPVDRYRLPALVACTVLAGAAVTVRAPARRRLVAAGIALAVAGVAWLPVRARDDALGHVLVAQALSADRAEPARIEERVRRALAEDPECGPALQLLGRLRHRAGRQEEAYDLYVRAAQDRRTRFSAQVYALPLLVDLGRLDEARRVAEGLLAENGSDVPLLAHAALVSAAAGGPSTPRELLQRARAIDPDHPAIRDVEARLR